MLPAYQRRFLSEHHLMEVDNPRISYGAVEYVKYELCWGGNVGERNEGPTQSFIELINHNVIPRNRFYYLSITHYL